ncbi:MAG: hypothetical protein HQL37_09995 [Alphaproteobacteria bacterium]|nr:hypothetical protein [Alphaproteobacteria bacterium]
MNMEQLMTFLTGAIQPALQQLGLDLEPGARTAAELLLLGTGLAESGYLRREQTGGGPALGYWQMEPFTHDDIWKTYLPARHSLAQALARIGGLAYPVTSIPPASLLTHSNPYAAAMARIKYRRSPRSLPDADDFDGMGRMWVEVYNAGGAATLARWRAEVEPALAAVAQTMTGG